MPQIKVHHAHGSITNIQPRPHSEKKFVSWLTGLQALLIKLIWGHYPCNFQEQTQAGGFISFTPSTFSRARSTVLPTCILIDKCHNPSFLMYSHWQMPQPLLLLWTFDSNGVPSQPNPTPPPFLLLLWFFDLNRVLDFEWVISIHFGLWFFDSNWVLDFEWVINIHFGIWFLDSNKFWILNG